MARPHFRAQRPLAGAARGGRGPRGRPLPPPLASPPASSPLAGGPGSGPGPPSGGRLRASPPPAHGPRRGGSSGGSPVSRFASGLARRLPHRGATALVQRRHGG